MDMAANIRPLSDQRKTEVVTLPDDSYFQALHTEILAAAE